MVDDGGYMQRWAMLIMMKCRNKIIFSEFKAKLREVLANYPSLSIKLNEFLHILLIHNIRFYSKEQLGKVSKFFDNPLRIAKITVPLSYLQLGCVQENNHNKYFIVKVSTKIISSFISDGATDDHSPSKCLNALTRILSSQYGSEKNWFKVLGGMTIAVTIDKNIFKNQVEKVLRNSQHNLCASKLVKHFTQNSHNNGCIEWTNFMRIVQRGTNSPRKLIHIRRSTTLDSSTQNGIHYNTASPFRKTEFIETETVFSTSTHNIKARSGQFWSSHTREKSIELKGQDFSLQSKQCQLYHREKSSRPSSKNVSHSVRHKTEPSIDIQNI